MRLYVEVARRTYARTSTYRSATIAGLFTNTVFGFLLAYVLLGVYAQRPEVGGFDTTDTLTFIFVSQGLLTPLGLFATTEIADRITTGDVMVDLQRPVRPPGLVGGGDVRPGRASTSIFRGIPPFLVGAIAFDLRLPSIANLAAFLVAFVLAVGISFGWRYLLQMSAFWIVDVRGPNQLGMLAAHFLCGAYIPIVFFPGVARGPLPGPAVRLDGPGADRDVAGAAHRHRSARRARDPAALARRAGRRSGGSCSHGRSTGWWCRVGSAIADLRVWRRLVGARIRADWQYRTSFFLFLLSQTLVACLDFAVIAAIFTQVRHARRLVGRRGGAALRPERRGVRDGRPAHQRRRERLPPHQGGHLRPVPPAAAPAPAAPLRLGVRASPDRSGHPAPRRAHRRPRSSRPSTGVPRPPCSCPSRW